MKVRITGLPEQVKAFTESIKEFSGLEINYISNEYKQNRKCKTSKYVAVYLDIQDYEKGENRYEWNNERLETKTTCRYEQF